MQQHGVPGPMQWQCLALAFPPALGSPTLMCSPCCLQHWTLLSVSLLNSLLSTACSVGLALAVALTIHSRGMHLVTGCNSSALPADARAAIVTNDCPFNTTRIYVSLQGHHTPFHSSSFCLCFFSSSFFFSLPLLPMLSLPFFLSPPLPLPFLVSLSPSRPPSLPHHLHSLFAQPHAGRLGAVDTLPEGPLTLCSAGHSPGALVPLHGASGRRSCAVWQVLFGGPDLPGHWALCTQLQQRPGMPHQSGQVSLPLRHHCCLFAAF